MPGHGGPDAVDGTEDVDPKGALPLLGGEVVDPTVRREDAGVADQHVEAAKAVDGLRDHRLDLGEFAHVGQGRRHRPVGWGETGHGLLERRRADIAQQEIGRGLTGQPVRHCRTEGASGSGDRDDPSGRCHISKYPPSTLSTVPVMNADASETKNW